MENAETRKVEYFECCYHSLDHTIKFEYEEEYNELTLSISLFQFNNFFKRIWIALKYIFNQANRYGHYDCVIINQDDKERLLSVINQLKAK